MKLKKTEYQLDPRKEEKVINHAKAKHKREAEKVKGINLSRNQAGGLKVEFSREF